MDYRVIILGLTAVSGLTACNMLQTQSATYHNPELRTPIQETATQSIQFENRNVPIPPAPGERVPLHPGPPVVEPLVVEEPVAVGPPSPAPIVETEPEPPLVAALRAFLEDDPEEAVAHLRDLKSSNEELMLQLIPAIVYASKLDMETGSPHQVGMLADELQRVLDTVAKRSPMIIKKALFCSEAKNYGRYIPFPDDHNFTPKMRVELYVEIGNIPSMPLSKGEGATQYVTHLVSTLKLHDSTGNIVPTLDKFYRSTTMLEESRREVTQSQIHDYFLVFNFNVPSEPGAYTVTLEISDPQTHRSVSKTMGFRVR